MSAPAEAGFVSLPYGACLLASGRPDFGSTERLAPQLSNVGRKGLLPSNHWHLCLIRSGSMVISLDGQEPVRVGSGKVLLLVPGMVGEVRPSPRCDWIRTAFHLTWQPRRMVNWGQVLPTDYAVQPGPQSLFGCSLPLLIPQSLLAATQRALMSIYTIYWRGPTQRLRAEATLSTVIANLVETGREQGPPTGGSHGRLEQSLRRFQEGDSMNSVADLAEASGLSTSRLRALMQRDYRQPPSEILKDRRIRNAMQLLTETSRQINDIAARVGYESPAAFIRAFRRRTGLSPGRWRRDQGA